MMNPLNQEADKEVEPFIQKMMRILNKYTKQKSVKSFCKDFNPYEKEKS